MKQILTFFIIFLLYASSLQVSAQSAQDKPINIVIMIGDGMGLPQFSIPYYYEDKEPVFSNFPYVGLVRTSSASHKITESAAGSTAMFTGRKTYNSAIGVDIDSVAQKNLSEVLSELNYCSGVIATSSITDATPAGFYAHEKSRDDQHSIAMDLIASDIDFFAGGGLINFIDPNGRDLFKENNMEVNFTRLKKISKADKGSRFGFLLAPDGMPAMLDGRGNYLPKATNIALDFLSRNNQGFILLVEGSQIDWASHSNNPDYVITEMLDFEKAVRTAYEFAEKDGNTLVIVTADHETGGFALAATGSEKTGADYNTISPLFATTNHTTSLVPLLAFGPGAESFAGIYENTGIFYKIIDLVTSK